jgi:hypothetical protein
MAHHYGEFFISYDFPKRLVEKNQTSGSVEQQNDKKEENKETKCSDTEK